MSKSREKKPAPAVKPARKPDRKPAGASKKESWMPLVLSVLVLAFAAALSYHPVESVAELYIAGLESVGLVLPKRPAAQEAPARRDRAEQRASPMEQPAPPRKQRPKRKRVPLPPPPPVDPNACLDSVQACAGWAKEGECEANAAYMKGACKVSCGVCAPEPGAETVAPFAITDCRDTNSNCATWASIGECETNPSFMKTQCPVTCRLCQSDDCHDYKDTDSYCASKAKGGGCYTVEGMREDCAWTCIACDLKLKPACKRDRSRTPSATEGSGDAMFEKIAGGGMATPSGRRYNVTVHSRDPWVLTIDDFLDEGEAERLLAAPGISSNWQRSQAGDGVLAARTSSTSWCRGACMRDTTINAVQDRVQALTRVPPENAEYLQVLQYHEGQFYKVHHDQNSPRSSAWGPRLYTFFMYLSDDLTGGETRFPLLNITVPPKKGRALLWPSVLSGAPYERDDRTDHEALPVKSGTKYAANYWLHMHPFRTLSDAGCGNTAYDDNWY